VLLRPTATTAAAAAGAAPAAAGVTVTVVGGTHNPMAPPAPFLVHCLLPQLSVAMGAARVALTLGRAGFYPAGGGRVQLAVAPPAHPPVPLRLTERGAPVARAAEALVSNLPPHVGAREAAEFARVARWPSAAVTARSVDAAGPGNVVVATMAYSHVTEVVSAYGERGRAAEAVAREAAEAAVAYETAPGSPPVGEHLADQLLLPLLVAAGGVFVTGALSSHFTTNAGVVRQFFGAGAVTWRRLDDREGECWEVTVAPWVDVAGAASAATCA
jgi:RNA 3'-terminal phosphate cyclase (ATP)